MRCEELLKGNGISGGAARVSWCERELLIGQSHILFYLIFSCLFKNTKYLLSKGLGLQVLMQTQSLLVETKIEGKT